MLLSLDSSTLWLSLALVDRSCHCVEEVLIGPPNLQSEALPIAIAALLNRHGMTLKRIDGFVVGRGPGSFTGLRIGLATMKGLAYAEKKPIMGASSLAALALDAPHGMELFACAVVKKAELYVGHYLRSDDGVKAMTPETSLGVEAFAQRLVASPTICAAGPALMRYRDALLALGVPEAQLLTTPHIPSAFALTRLVHLPSSYSQADVFALEPYYLRRSGAEENSPLQAVCVSSSTPKT